MYGRMQHQFSEDSERSAPIRCMRVPCRVILFSYLYAVVSSLYFHNPYVFGRGCHNLIVPSSLPLANISPSGLNSTQWTGPW